MNIFAELYETNKEFYCTMFTAILIFSGLIAFYFFYAQESWAKIPEERMARLQFTSTELTLMKTWGLSTEDYKLFRDSKDLASGIVNTENLTYYEILGFLTPDPKKRREYARKQAELDLLVIERLRNFEELHHAEIARLATAGRVSP